MSLNFSIYGAYFGLLAPSLVVRPAELWWLRLSTCWIESAFITVVAVAPYLARRHEFV